MATRWERVLLVEVDGVLLLVDVLSQHVPCCLASCIHQVEQQLSVISIHALPNRCMSFMQQAASTNDVLAETELAPSERSLGASLIWLPSKCCQQALPHVPVGSRASQNCRLQKHPRHTSIQHKTRPQKQAITRQEMCVCVQWAFEKKTNIMRAHPPLSLTTATTISALTEQAGGAPYWQLLSTEAAPPAKPGVISTSQVTCFTYPHNTVTAVLMVQGKQVEQKAC